MGLVLCVQGIFVPNERLAVLYALTLDPECSSENLSGAVRSHVPASHWTEEQILEEARTIMAPTKVPNWFHEMLTYSKTIKTVTDLPTDVPGFLTRSFVKSEERARIAQVWMDLCVEPTQSFLTMSAEKHCEERMIVIDGVRMSGWTLSRGQIAGYLVKLAYNELQMLKAQQGLESPALVTEGAEQGEFETSAVPTIFPEDSIEKAILDDFLLRSLGDSIFGESEGDDLLVNEIISDQSTFAASSADASQTPSSRDSETVCLSGKKRKRDTNAQYITNLIRDVQENKIERDIEQVAFHKMPRSDEDRFRFNLIRDIMKPAWFHAALLTLKTSNDAAQALKTVGGKKPSRSMLAAAHMWQKYCIAPLSRFSRGYEIPCKHIEFQENPDGVSGWFILSKSQIIAYLTDRLQDTD